MIPEPILVTGGSGMLGSALCARLSELGFQSLIAPTRAELDLFDFGSVDTFLANHRPKTVFHLAGFVRGIAGNLEAGVQALRANARLQFSLLDSALIYEPEVIVVAGTVAAYAYPYVHLPLKERDFWSGSPHGAEGFYAAGKRVAIPFLEAFSQLGIGARLAILTNLFGSRDHFGEHGAHVVPSLVARFVDASRAGSLEVPVWGSPSVTRDFLWAEDAVRYLIDIAADGARSRGYVAINVASGNETTMGELVAMIADAAAFRGKVRWEANAPIGVPRRAMDVERLRSISRHVPSDLPHAIEMTVRSYLADRYGFQA